MKNIYFTLALVLLGFASCKNANAADENSSEAIDTTAVNQNTAADDTLTYDADTTAIASDTATNSADAKSNVKLPNKISTTEKVIPGEKGKYSLAETKWELVELNGKAVESSGRDYFINFDSKSGTFRSFVGCNRITGNYFMKSEGKVGFSNLMTTRKMCDDNDAERTFFNNLQKVDNYMIVDNGKTLHLHIGKKAVAEFKAKR